MKIEWWCEPAPSAPGHVALLAQVNGNWTFASAFSWHPEFVKPTKAVLTMAVNSIEQQMAFTFGGFAPCPKGEVAELECSIFYPQGLFKLPEPKRWAVLGDEPRGKKLKFTPKGGGPRNRWGGL